jgi:hypothetical protein
MKGLDFLPKPYISKIILEKGNLDPFDQKGFVNLYWDDKEVSNDNQKANKRMKITFNLSFKALYMGDQAQNSNATKNILKTLQNTAIVGYRFTNENILKTFLETEDKSNVEFIQSLAPNMKIYAHMNTIKSLKNYIYYDGNKNIVSVPLEVSDFYEYSETNLSGDPNFLAYLFFPVVNQQYLSNNLFTSEIIFRQGALLPRTTYFRIENIYSSGDATYSMDSNDQQTQKIIANYGSPGDLWCGSVYRDGEYFMAGSSKSNGGNPFLKIYVADNDKIIDLRISGLLEDMFSYDSTQFIDQLAFVTTPSTSFKRNAVVDNINEKKVITTEVEYSIRRLTSDEDYSLWAPTGEIKDKVNLFFGIDLGRLLKNTTMAPGLLDRLVATKPDFLTKFIDQIDFIQFDISRINVTTGESKLLLSSNNAISFNDMKTTNKGSSFEWMRNIDIRNDDKTIRFYEFRDGELDTSKYNNQTFKYSIKVRFRDPLLAFINDALLQTQTILKDLDELLLKLSLKICDPKYGKRFDVFNRFYQKINPVFIERALNPDQSGRVLTFDFNANGVPQSLSTGFSGPLSGGAALGSTYLHFLLVSMGGKFDAIRPMDEYPSWPGFAAKGAAFLVDLQNSTKLTTTNPTLIQNTRNLLSLLENKLVTFLNIYNGAVTSKAESGGFSYEAYTKNQGQTDTKLDDTTVVEYEETFSKELDLSKTKNNFDWTTMLGPSQHKPDGSGYYNHKLIHRDVYMAAIEQPLKFLMQPADTPVQWPTNLASRLLSTESAYSFLPYYTMNEQILAGPLPWAGSSDYPKSSKFIFNLFNYESFQDTYQYIEEWKVNLFPWPYNSTGVQGTTTTGWATDFEEKNYQVMRKKLFDRHTNKGRNILIPELLTYFGVKLPTVNVLNSPNLDLSLDPILSKEGDLFQPTSPGFDNFGDPTLTVVEKPSDSGKVVGQNDIESGGATDNIDYAWGGGALKYYDVDVAKKLINLVFSDNTQNFRNLGLFSPNNPWFAEHMNDSEITNFANHPDRLDNQSPMPIQLLALFTEAYDTGPATGDGLLIDEANWEGFFRYIFKSATKNGTKSILRLENYYLYILFLCLFGKVRFLRGFVQAESPGGRPKMTPTSYYYNNQVKAYDWAPLTKAVLDNMESGKMLYCCVQLNVWGPGQLIDNEYVKLFLKYFNNNQYFYLTTGAEPIG